jgi:hypothetical protein
MAITITWKTKGKAKKYTTHTRTKEGRKLIPFVVGNYLTHNPFHVACMQIVRFNSNRRSRTTSFTNTIFLFIIEVKALKNTILKHCLKN